MSKSRLTFAALAVAVAALAPVSSAHAAADLTDTVGEIAADAADLAGQEQMLLAVLLPSSDLPEADLVELRAQLRSIDAQGAATLDQLTDLNVELTDAIRVVLDRLPATATPESTELDLQSPPQVVYDAAIADLLRISATPEAVIPGTSPDRGPAAALLVVAVLALLTLMVFAFASSIRRRPVGDQLADAAWSDDLTGFANRRRLDHDLKSGDRHHGPAAVIMVDIDHFELVSDSFGHHEGDDVLRAIATMLANQIRFDDVVYRFGGEEFCVLLPESSTEDAEKVADRIVQAARQIRLPDGQHVTVSVGVAASAKGNVGTAMEYADRALCEAKDLGRDQAVTANRAEFVGA